jgi:hypothetical protein
MDSQRKKCSISGIQQSILAFLEYAVKFKEGCWFENDRRSLNVVWAEK